MQIITRILTLCLGSLFALNSAAQTYPWTVTRLDAPAGAGTLAVSDINNAGQIVGFLTSAAGKKTAFVYENGALQNLGSLSGSGSSSAAAINNYGHIVGWSSDFDSNGQTTVVPFIYKNGSMSRLNGLTDAYDINDLGIVAGAVNYGAALYDSTRNSRVWYDSRSRIEMSRAHAVNNLGQVVGIQYDFLGDDGHAFIHDPATGQTSVIPLAQDHFGSATDINNRGTVIGTDFTYSNERYIYTTFLYRNGTTTPFATLANERSCAVTAINNVGTLGGWIGAFNSNWQLVTHAVIYEAETVTDLNDGLNLGDGSYLSTVLHINDRGDIVASSNTSKIYLLKRIQ